MALPYAITALIFTLVLALVNPSTGNVVKGSISCLDCNHNDDLHGIRLVVKCDQVQKLSMAITDDNGFFEANLPSSSSSSSSSNCVAKLLGGPKQLCAFRKNIVSKVVKGQDSNSYTISKPISIFTSCPSKNEAKIVTSLLEIESPKIINVPLPLVRGLSPPIYYFPVIPIIGEP